MKLNALIFSCLVGLVLMMASGCESRQDVAYEHAFKDANLTIEDERFESLSERHLAYWEAFSKKRFDESYAFELPYLCYLKSPKWYKEFHASNNQFYKITQLDITLKDDDFAIVTTRYELGENEHEFADPWYYVNGTWYHFFRTSKLPLADELNPHR